MIIIGCDFHSRFQQIALLDTETGEIEERRLEHESGEAGEFYRGLKEPALVGMESTGYAIWFEELLSERGHQLVVGDAARIRAQVVRKQKTDRNDALHLLELLRRGDFPRIWMPSVEDGDTRVLLQHRHNLVQMRTRVKNGLQALAMTYGVYRRWKLWTLRGQCELRHLPLRAGMARRRADLIPLLKQFNDWIEELDELLVQEVERRVEATRLLTHPGVGPLTALAAILILGPAERFENGKKVASYVGLIPTESSSGGRQHFGRLSKQGNRLLRCLLVEAGQSACRGDPGLRRWYQRLVFRKGPQKAKAAVARKLAIRLYVMLRDQIDYREFCRRGSHAGMPGNFLISP